MNNHNPLIGAVSTNNHRLNFLYGFNTNYKRGFQDYLGADQLSTLELDDLAC